MILLSMTDIQTSPPGSIRAYYIGQQENEEIRYPKAEYKFRLRYGV